MDELVVDARCKDSAWMPWQARLFFPAMTRIQYDFNNMSMYSRIYIIIYIHIYIHRYIYIDT